MKKIFTLVLLAMLALPGMAGAQFQAGDREFTLSGSGSSNDDFDSTNISVAGSYGYFFSPNMEALLRQSLLWADVEGGSDFWRASTAVAADWHFNLMSFQPFLGAAFGYSYGDGEDSFFAGPEGGVKFFVTDTAFIQGLVQYQWFFDEIGGIDEGTSDGNFIYALGLGIKF